METNHKKVTRYVLDILDDYEYSRNLRGIGHVCCLAEGLNHRIDGIGLYRSWTNWKNVVEAPVPLKLIRYLTELPFSKRENYGNDQMQ
jgi:hypothetical protein